MEGRLVVLANSVVVVYFDIPLYMCTIRLFVGMLHDLMHPFP